MLNISDKNITNLILSNNQPELFFKSWFAYFLGGEYGNEIGYGFSEMI
jgi:hypothetical protein